MLKYTKAALALVVFAILLVGGLRFAHVMGPHVAATAPLTDQLDAALDRVAYYERILDLSTYYGIDPAIVILVDQRAQQVYPLLATHSDFVPSPETLTRRMLAIIFTESRGDPSAIGDSGRAIGLTQMWLTTAALYDPKVSQSDLLDPVYHVQLAFAHFLDLLDKNGGDPLLAFVAWNYGQRGALEVIQGRRRMNDYAMRALRAPLHN
jgi:hypothetical protein